VENSRREACRARCTGRLKPPLCVTTQVPEASPGTGLGRSRERVTGIEPAFSAWESVPGTFRTRRVSRKAWSEHPCRPAQAAKWCPMLIRYGTDMARHLRAQGCFQHLRPAVRSPGDSHYSSGVAIVV
jgi:hypothetical protein